MYYVGNISMFAYSTSLFSKPVLDIFPMWEFSIQEGVWMDLKNGVMRISHRGQDFVVTGFTDIKFSQSQYISGSDVVVQSGRIPYLDDRFFAALEEWYEFNPPDPVGDMDSGGTAILMAVSILALAYGLSCVSGFLGGKGGV
jgi:hypothetical protein